MHAPGVPASSKRCRVLLSHERTHDDAAHAAALQTRATHNGYDNGYSFVVRLRLTHSTPGSATARWGGIERTAGGASQGERGSGGREGGRDRDRASSSRGVPGQRTYTPQRRRSEGEGDSARVWGDEVFGGDEAPRRPQPGGWGEDSDRRPFRSGPPRSRPFGGTADSGETPQRKWLTSRERREAQPDAKPTWVETLQGEALFGVAPVRAALLAKRRGRVYTLFVQDSLEPGKRKDGGAVADCVARATAWGATIQQVDKHELNLLTDNRNHQGVVLDADPLEPEELDVLPPVSSPTQRPVWIALDQVSDPQNLGAILRSALFLGAAGVVVAQRNSAPLSPVVSKASAGAMEVLPVHAVSGNMPQFLAACSANGWTVLGADMGDGAAAAGGAVPCSDVAVTGPTILVLGSEGEGLRTNVVRACDRLICVPRGAAPEGDAVAAEALAFMDSLTVSVAAGVVLHSLLLSASRSKTD